ncbi:MAG: ABC transporter ATP-binding protein [Spirochaetales bacterium]|nr:ABC transporter ATP-binding protein [Spirochaetales bacterium]
MITVRDLHKTYRSGESAVRALRGVDMTIADGEFLAVAGPSGSGKSTLLNIIGCLDRPDGGSVSIDEREMAELNARGRADYRRENLGFVFQSFNLIPVLTAYENVAFSLHLLNVPQGEIKERTSSILREVGLAGMENRRPSRLSGGQQQRVAIARALVKNPTIILADEPTANLDSETGRSILDAMEEINVAHGTTFLFSTHDPTVMERSRRLVRLHDGVIVEDTTRDAG